MKPFSLSLPSGSGQLCSEEYSGEAEVSRVAHAYGNKVLVDIFDETTQESTRSYVFLHLMLLQ
jgi:hypothetical protein